MKDTDRLRIERCLEEFSVWRASGMALKAYVQLRGEELSHWRARLSWERRRRQMLNGTYTKSHIAPLCIRAGHPKPGPHHCKSPTTASATLRPATDKPAHRHQRQG